MAESLRCVNHPNVETYLRCNKCGQPICAKCAVRTPVGYRCRNCVKAQQQVFYADFSPIHYLVAAAVALPLSLVASWLVPMLSFYVIFVGPAVGGVIAKAAHWAIGRRRGKYTWLVVCSCIVLGSLSKLVLPALAYLFMMIAWPNEAAAPSMLPLLFAGGMASLIWDVVYVVTAVGAAYAMLRPGRRV